MSDWHDRAACRAAVNAGLADPDWWFPTGDKASVATAARRACTICDSCAVRDECLEANRDVPVGIFGGQSARLRLGMWVGNPVTRACAECGSIYEAPPESRANVCSKECRTDRRRRQYREFYEDRTGRDAHEGSISRYHAGCRCSRCREAARKARRRTRQAANV